MTGSRWRISDELWEKLAPLIPEHKTNHPLGTHRKRVDNRTAMNAIFFVLRTGCQWNALNATGYVLRVLHIVASLNGAIPVSLNAFGKTVCLHVNSWTVGSKYMLHLLHVAGVAAVAGYQFLFHKHQ